MRDIFEEVYRKSDDMYGRIMSIDEDNGIYEVSWIDGSETLVSEEDIQ